MYNKVELCGVNTAELPILSEQEKRDLLTRARAGDKAARQSMIEGNLRLVLSVVQRFSQRGENMDDLFQVGCIGLIKAIDNFDPAQQVRFSTYGVPMIIGEIRRFLRDNNALRVSRSLRDTAYRAMQSREELEKQLGREPTVEEIAQKTGLPRREVSAALESVVEPLSLEEPVYADGGDAVYVIDQVRDKMIGGEAAIGVIYSGEIMYIQDEVTAQNLPFSLEYVIPEEGTNVWLDSWVVPKNAKNKENAEKWINFLCRPDVAVKNFEYITYATPNKAAKEMLDEEIQNNKAVFPDAKQLKNCEVYRYLGDEADELYNSLWKEVKSD